MTRESFSKRVAKLLASAGSLGQWERLIGALLDRLELSEEERADAVAAYERLGGSIARRLGLQAHEVHVYPQGSMRTQTTISPRGNQKFDLDVIVELHGGNFVDAEEMFALFGEALRGDEAVTGAPQAKRRCWRLPYTNKDYYFDVTPALPDPLRVTHASLRVRDPSTGWSPSNPEEFAQWFCRAAARRFPFQEAVLDTRVIKAKVEPLPSARVGLDDILRRSLQLMKLHRENMYWNESDTAKDAKPISVILVTLATHAFEELWAVHRHEFTSAIEVVLAVVENMSRFVEVRDGKKWVANPMLRTENFADRWNTDGGVRTREFARWVARFEQDVETLLLHDVSKADEQRVRAVFGQKGVEAWKASQPKPPVLQSLVASSAQHTRSNPTAPIKPGSKGTLA